MTRTLAASACAWLVAGCVQLSFDRDLRLEAIPKSAFEGLEPGRTDLEAALLRLGPPVFAWELPEGGMALAWGWLASSGWQMKVSAPITGRGESVSVDYSSSADRMRGAVLFFDRGLQLEAIQQGLLRDLRKATRPRPTAEHEHEQGTGNGPAPDQAPQSDEGRR